MARRAIDLLKSVYIQWNNSDFDMHVLDETMQDVLQFIKEVESCPIVPKAEGVSTTP